MGNKENARLAREAKDNPVVVVKTAKPKVIEVKKVKEDKPKVDVFKNFKSNNKSK